MEPFFRWSGRMAAGAALALSASCLGGCSVKQFAIRQLSDALAESGSVFASDDDLELVGAAVPFSLKLIEALLQQAPEDRGLLLAAAQGFTQYSYGWVAWPAEQLEEHDLAGALAQRERAARLAVRARDYALRALELEHPLVRERLVANPREALARVERRDVELLYWSAASWGLALSLSKNNPELVAEQPQIEALIDRALELDPDWGGGSLHAFLIGYEQSRIGADARAEERARAHFARAFELSGGHSAGIFLGLAEAVSLPKQDRAEYERLLEAALAVDEQAAPDLRLSNELAKQRVRWKLARLDELFL